MDKKIKETYGKVYFGEDFDKLIFSYISEHPNITAKKLADVRMKPRKKYNSPTDLKIASPFVAKMYIDIFRKITKNI